MEDDSDDVEDSEPVEDSAAVEDDPPPAAGAEAVDEAVDNVTPVKEVDSDVLDGVEDVDGADEEVLVVDGAEAVDGAEDGAVADGTAAVELGRPADDEPADGG